MTVAGLAETLASAEDVTIFAPSNAAFAQIPQGDRHALLADMDLLTSLLLYHVVPEEIRFRQLEEGPLDTLLEGEQVEIEVQEYFFGWYRIVRVDGATITQPNIHADFRLAPSGKIETSWCELRKIL